MGELVPHVLIIFQYLSISFNIFQYLSYLMAFHDIYSHSPTLPDTTHLGHKLTARADLARPTKDVNSTEQDALQERS